METRHAELIGGLEANRLAGRRQMRQYRRLGRWQRERLHLTVDEGEVLKDGFPTDAAACLQHRRTVQDWEAAPTQPAKLTLRA